MVQREFARGHTAPLVYAEMNYLGDQAGKPLYHTSDPARSRMRLEPHVVAVHDARSIPAPSVDREGFQLLHQQLPDMDLRDAAVRDGPYLVLLQELVRTSLGASKVISDTSILRLPGPKAVQKPLLTVHSDYTPASARRLLGESWDQAKGRDEGLVDTARLIEQSVDGQAGARRFGRVIAVNVWRPISDPPHDYPLAVCARSSLAPADVRPADFIEDTQSGDPYEGELSLCAYSPRHEWYCFSDMTPDEVLVFLGFDFSDSAPCGAMHSAFRDPGCPASAPGRASVEVRAFAFFDA